MRKLILTCIAITSLVAHGKAQTLFQFGNNAVTKDEFLRVYKKNSMNKQPDMSEAALREYLDLYSLFRMKVNEARNQRIDTVPSVQYDLNNYRKQLSKNYLTDEKMNEKLIKEAYDRMKEEVHVAHILIYNSQYAQSQDTVAAYKKIDSIYNAITKNKASFAEMASKYSDDVDSKVRGGDIGYFTSMQTVYPFENVAYTTPVGKVSAPFRTQFGYHIIKVIDKREATGQLEVAQIMVATPKSKGEEGIAAARKKIDSALTALKKGTRFEDAVKQYSEDKFSVNEGGVLKVFGVGDMTPEFEKAAYALKKPGDISEPVQTEYGIHIIKLIRKIPVKPFDSVKNAIKRRVDNDSRAMLAKIAFMERIKQQNGFKEYPANMEALLVRVNKIPDTGKNANAFTAADFKNMTQSLFTFDNKNYTQADLMAFAETLTRGRLMGVKNSVMKDIYTMFITNTINDFEERKLVSDNPEFKNLMDEYADGIMLFELMDRNVWSKASKDTVGLKKFYEANKTKYTWEPGFKGAIYTFKTEAKLEEGKKMLAKKDTKDQDLMKKLNTETMSDAVIIQRGHYEFSKFKDFPKEAIVKGKLTEVKKNDDGTYTVVKVDEVFNTDSPKSLDEARGYVVAEYQDYLEKTWNADMRKKYPLKVDEAVFKSMVQ